MSIDKICLKNYGTVKWVKGIKYIIAEGNWTLCGRHTIEYIIVKL